jgi:hypothetical protein
MQRDPESQIEHDGAKEKLNDWMSSTPFDILHVDQDGTNPSYMFLIVTGGKHPSINRASIFKLAGEWKLSVDVDQPLGTVEQFQDFFKKLEDGKRVVTI